MTQHSIAAGDVPQRQVRELIDRDEITRLVYRLGVCLDEGRFAEMASLLTADAIARTPGGEAHGRAALIAQAGRNHSADRRIQHVITNVLVTPDGDDRAEIRANLIATFTATDATSGTATSGTAAGTATGTATGNGSGGSERRLAPEPAFTLGEVYRFEAVRTPDGWRLSFIQTTPVWSAGVLPRPS